MIEERAALALARRDLDLAIQARCAAVRPREIRQAEAAITRARGRFFAPLTCGYHLPEDSGLPGAWRAPGDEPFVSGILSCAAGTRDLERLGITVRSRIGDVFTVLVPWSELDALTGLGSVRSFELTRSLFPSENEPQLQFAGVRGLHDSGLRGGNALVGIIDLWLDFGHPDFLVENHTRVVSFWDQAASVPGQAPAAFPYGVEYDQVAIDKALSGGPDWPAAFGYPAAPLNDHGTKVAGCAAGRGLEDPGARGPAPEAKIVFVKCKGLAGFLAESDSVLDAFHYIFRKAASLDRPCVVNLSYNDHVGPHDGSTDFDEAIGDLLKEPGRAVTISAGNTNGLRQHVNSTEGGTATPVRAVFDDFLEVENVVSDTLIDIWSNAADRFDLRVEWPAAGGDLPTESPIVQPGTPPRWVEPEEIPVWIHSQILRPENGDNLIHLAILPTGGRKVPGGILRLRLRRAISASAPFTGVFHAWIRGLDARWSSPTASYATIAEPATGSAAITVGAHGYDPLYPDLNWLRIWDESCCGPTRKSHLPDKPDLVAEGVGVTAPSFLENPAGYVVSNGTSFAAPFVAGTCALLFDPRLAGPDATCADLKHYLTEGAGKLFYEGGPDYGPYPIAPMPNVMYGQGRVRFPPMRFLRRIARPHFDVWSKDWDLDRGFEPDGNTVTWASPDIRIVQRGVRGGRSVLRNPVAEAGPSEQQVEVIVRNRGRRIARNTDVYLYWAGPSTCLPFPEAWRSDGIFTGSSRGWVQGHRIRVRRIEPGGRVKVRFGWSPPRQRSGPCDEAHYSLLARLECKDDPTELDRGGRIDFGHKNNTVVRNVLARRLDEKGRASMTFLLELPRSEGAASVEEARRTSALLVQGRWKDGAFSIELPVEALPWRDLAYLEGHGGRPAPYGARSRSDPKLLSASPLRGSRIHERTDVEGAVRISVRDGTARIAADGKGRVFIPSLRVEPGAALPVTLRVSSAEITKTKHSVHATHYCDGRRIGGVTLDLCP